MPALADGDLERAMDLNIEEAQRCYDELGLRGAGELVATGWYADDPTIVRLWQKLAELRMYTVFHTGVFGSDPADWILKVDISFGPAADYQLQVWQRSIDTLPPATIMYGTDMFWPMDPAEYREQSTSSPNSGSSRPRPRAGI